MFCSQCGKMLGDGQSYCQSCGNRVAETSPDMAGRQKSAWEARAQRGFFAGLFTTLKESLFSPSDFFRKLSVTGGLADPLLYALITGMGGIMAASVWRLLLQDRIHGYFPHEVESSGGMDFLSGVGMALTAVVAPFAFMAFLFLWAGLLHLLLVLVRGVKHGFEATFRTVAYGAGANLFLAIPFCGSFIAMLWSVVLAIIGLREMHSTTGGKAAFAVLFPFLLCCGIAAIVAVAIFGTIAASISSMPAAPWK